MDLDRGTDSRDRPDSSGGDVHISLDDERVVARLADDDHRVLVSAEGRFDRDGAIRVQELSTEAEAPHVEGVAEVLRRLEGHRELRFRFSQGSEEMDPRRLDLLSPSDDADRVWADLGRQGPTDHFESARRAELEALARFAEARLATLTGEVAPDLAGRVEFLPPEEFARLVSDPERTLGAYSPVTGRLIVKDVGDLRAHGVIIHEGLHALRHERAAAAIPRELDEAVTEYFTRLADPQASASQLLRTDVDGVAEYAVRGLVSPVDLGDVRIVRLPAPYEDRQPIVGHIAETVGRGRLWEYYRTGDPEEIRLDYDARVGPGAWARLVDRCSRGDWEPQHRPRER